VYKFYENPQFAINYAPSETKIFDIQSCTLSQLDVVSSGTCCFLRKTPQNGDNAVQDLSRSFKVANFDSSIEA